MPKNDYDFFDWLVVIKENDFAIERITTQECSKAIYAIFVQKYDKYGFPIMHSIFQD